MRNEWAKLMSDQLGSRLTQADYLVHFSDGTINALVSCQLTFGSGTVVVRNGSDGATLIIEDSSPEELDLGDYGFTKLLSSDAYDPAEAKACLGRCLDRYRVFVEPDRMPSGLELSFGGRNIAFHNCGDELKPIKSLAILSSGKARLSDWCME